MDIMYIPGVARPHRWWAHTRRWWWRRGSEVEDPRRTPAGLHHLFVELIHQKALQRKLCRDTDTGADHRQQNNLGEE